MKKSTEVQKETVITDELVFLQYKEGETTIESIRDRVIADYEVNEKKQKIEKIRIYVKPEDNCAYYVINDEYAGSVELV